ncbi:tRNA-modifying protein YgfZ [Halomonadaceae bacterium LMG 33818]|uniref:CAF17-like 4Fe-4S cluster assembly/insertion protein YgfZ n=1 Tax=Cernens ardua TaxID=3402176 RepID=UPI003EDC84FC
MPAGDSHTTSFTVQPLTTLSAIQVSGKDAERFLQGQISANAAHANGQFAPYGVFCTPKGRVLANVQLVKRQPDVYWLLGPLSTQTLLITHLKKYGVFFKATLETIEIHAYGLTGSANAIADFLNVTALPDLPNEVRSGDKGIIIRASGNNRWLVIQQEALPTTTAPFSDTCWWQQEIQQGVAWLDESQSDKWLPQMLNLEALGGISFKKGCYTGQEVVARAHYRGQVKKRVALFTAPTGSDIHIGDTVQVKESEKTVGTVINAQAATEHIVLLAVVNLSDEPRTLVVNGAILREAPLPYPLERVDPETMVAKVEAKRI